MLKMQGSSFDLNPESADQVGGNKKPFLFKKYGGGESGGGRLPFVPA